MTLAVVGRGFDLFAFTPDPVRAQALGLQTGALVGACWAVLCPSTLTAIRDPDDGWTATLRSSTAGLNGLWWGAWGGQIALGLGLVVISVLTTSVMSMLSGLPTPIDLAAGAGAGAAVVLSGLVASATTAWAGNVAGALVGLLAFLAGQTGTVAVGRAFGPAPVGTALSISDALRSVALAVGAVAVAQAGLRRLRK